MLDGHARGPAWRDRYLLGLCIVLGGYAVIGKGFAALGVAPLFIGEAVLGLGLCAIVATGCAAQLLATGTSLLLLILIGWIAVRVLPGVQAFGMIALRDAVIVGYGLFAFIVVALLTERPERLGIVVSLYRRFASWYGFAAAPVFYAVALLWSPMPTWPYSGVSLISVRPGEIAVHLAGAVAFTLAGFRRATPLWVIMVLLGIAIISPSRGATLACVVPIAAAVVLTGKAARLAPYALAGVCLFAVAYAADVDVDFGSGRTLGPRQIVNNAISIVGTSNEANMDNTKAWRLAWWSAIQDYTIRGPYFWTGKGFGESLAEIDGFVVGEENGGPLLRSPHNGHLTLLARAGVPGLALWAATCLSWFVAMLNNALLARRRNEPGWSGLFIWLVCYVAAILIDASFDVALEGPMLGVWFWCLFGLGIGSTMIYRAWIGATETQRVRAVMQAGPRQRGIAAP